MKLQTPKDFNEVEHDTWKRLFNNLEDSRSEQAHPVFKKGVEDLEICLLYTSPSPRDQRGSRMPSSA